MKNKQQIKIRILFGGLLAVSLWSGMAQAGKYTEEYSSSVRVTTLPSFYVKTDGSKYTGLSADKPPTMTIGALFSYDAPDNDLIKSYHLQFRAKWEAAGVTQKYLGPHEQKSYPLGSRPKKVEAGVVFHIGKDFENFVVNACNTTANGFRMIGQSNAQIFSHEHNVNLQLFASHAVDVQAVPPGSFASQGPYPEDTYAKIICMKAPMAQFDTPDQLNVSTAVSQAALSILEQSTIGGSCKIKLSAKVKTTLPNTEVRFRFEHSSGRKSDVKTVTTGQNKTAVEDYWYDIPNNKNGGEIGMIRMVGVSHTFESAWKNYEMNCRDKGPSSLSLVQKPTVKIDVKPTHFSMLNGMRCPSQVEITTSISSKKPFNGTGVMLVKGSAQAFTKHEVNVQPYLVWKKTEQLPLKPWTASGAGNGTLQIQPGGQSNQKSQRFDLRYILSANMAPVVQTPYKTVVVRCTELQVSPGAQGLTTPAGPSVAPRPVVPKNLELKMKRDEKDSKVPVIQLSR